MVGDEVGSGPDYPGDKDAPAGSGNQGLVGRVAPLHLAGRGGTPTARQLLALARQLDRLRRESVQLREQAAALGVSSAAASSERRVEVVRKALLRVRARVRALETRAQASPLPQAAAAKLDALRLEAGRLGNTLQRVISAEVPADPD